MPPRRWTARTIASIVFAGVVVAVAAYLLVRNWNDIRAVTAQIGVRPMLASAALCIAGTALITRIWQALLTGVGVEGPRRDVNQVFFVTQLGKYLPGSVWPVVAQMEAGRRWEASRGQMLVASGIMLAILTATGLALGAALLPWSSDAGLREYWWTLLFLVPLAAVLHPKVLPWLIDCALMLVGRAPANVRLTWRAMLLGCTWSLAVWCTLGLHVYVLIASLGVRSWGAVAGAVGGMALAWAVGLIIIPAPAGAGVRDAVLGLTISPLVGPAAALAIALASRFLLLFADLFLAGLSMILARRSGPGHTARTGSTTAKQ